jgi:hypothetical protein
MHTKDMDGVQGLWIPRRERGSDGQRKRAPGTSRRVRWKGSCSSAIFASIELVRDESFDRTRWQDLLVEYCRIS